MSYSNGEIKSWCCLAMRIYGMETQWLVSCAPQQQDMNSKYDDVFTSYLWSCSLCNINRARDHECKVSPWHHLNEEKLPHIRTIFHFSLLEALTRRCRSSHTELFTQCVEIDSHRDVDVEWNSEQTDRERKKMFFTSSYFFLAFNLRLCHVYPHFSNKFL